MAKKKGRDLFEVLGARAKGSRPAVKQESVAPVGFGDLGDWLRGLIPQRSPSRKSKRGSASAGPRWGGLAVAGLVFVVFGLGFLIGRGTSGAAVVDGAELRSPAEPIAAAPTWLSPEEEEKCLSKNGLQLLYYSALERGRAVELARWLRAEGLPTARVCRMQDPDTSESLWVVVCYTEDSAGAAELAKLEQLDASVVDPRWNGMTIRRLNFSGS